MKAITTVFVVIATALLAQARVMRSWTYQELYDKADLVVIANPTSVEDTAEQTVLPGIAPDINVVGRSAHFDISVVMKGDQGLKKLVLHHYWWAYPAKLAMNGPTLAQFDPTENRRYLLFLQRESDGRYAPVSGQIDPAMISILRLNGFAR
jgi:hypothetical protein